MPIFVYETFYATFASLKTIYRVFKLLTYENNRR
jgi:hypothetical protein